MKKQEGITLISLIITIIIMLILAGVALSMVTGDGSVVEQAISAVDKTENAQHNEEAQIEEATDFVLSKTGQMTKVGAGEYTGNENRRYSDGVNSIVVPAGFTVSNLENEKTISKGLVIYSGNQEGKDLTTIQNSVNQYVWIPVNNPSDIYGTITQADIDLNPNKGLILGAKYGKLYDFGNSTNGFITSASAATHKNWPSEAGYLNSGNDVSQREPAPLNTSEETLGINSVEFDKMIQSVEKYKGFYIGRYELTTNGIVKGTNPLTSVTLSDYYGRALALENSNADASGKIVTTMIWGCQYDQALKVSLGDKSDFLTNASDYGVYGADGVANTGTKNPVYNIFDMSGNVWDWTLESCNTGYHSRRGSRYYGNSASEPASHRSQGSAGGSSSNGCRVQLYLN